MALKFVYETRYERNSTKIVKKLRFRKICTSFFLEHAIRLKLYEVSLGPYRNILSARGSDMFILEKVMGPRSCTPRALEWSLLHKHTEKMEILTFFEMTYFDSNQVRKVIYYLEGRSKAQNIKKRHMIWGLNSFIFIFF